MSYSNIKAYGVKCAPILLDTNMGVNMPWFFNSAVKARVGSPPAENGDVSTFMT